MRVRILVILIGALVLTTVVALVPALRDTRVMLRAAAIRAGVSAGLEREDIEFQSAGATLSGSFVFPSREAYPSAAVVLVHGSGPSERLLHFAYLFAAEGIAVFTYDKRGVGESGGTFIGGDAAGTRENFNLLAEDAAAAARLVVDHPRLQRVAIGYVGFSQGGWIAPMAATRPPEISFVMLFSGPVTTLAEEDHFSQIAEGDDRFWDRHTRDNVAAHMRSAPRRDDDVDMTVVLRRLVQIPVFWTFGGRDNVVPIDLSMQRLDEFASEGQARFYYKAYPDYGHELVTFDVANLSLSEPFKDSVRWIRTVGVR